ncbi:MAG TPA: S9 family peptidase, partial [Thermomicrobiaceae bacterium]|nr:S9 family peptidase [Thermomicrobiaceae bacterium]
ETKKPASQLWLCAPDGSNKRQLTQTGTRNRGGRWSPDGTSIAFVSDRVGKGKAGLFVLDVARPGEARAVTKHNQELGALAWSPDGKTIAYTTTFDPENPDEEERDKDAAPPVRVTRRFDYKWDGRGYVGEKRSQIWTVGVASGERTMLTHEPVDHNAPEWSPDGKTISCTVANANAFGNHLCLIDVASGEKKLIGPEGGSVGSWSYSPDGTRIVYAADEEQTHQPDLYLYDVASGTAQRLTDDLPVMPAGGMPGEGLARPVWLDDHEVLLNATRAGASGLYTFNVATAALEPMVTLQASLAGLSVDAGKRLAAAGYASFEATGELFVYDLREQRSDVITDYNGELLKEHPPARWERFEVQRGKYPIEAWLLKPPDFDPAKQYPLILSIHGGPNGAYGYGFTAQLELLATNGFLVAFANPRGSTTYGREFTMQVFQDWGGEDYQDLMAVVDKVLEEPYADASRTGIVGYSYGGYMTSWIIGQTQRFQACVCGAPVFDLEAMVGTSDISHRTSDQQWGGTPATTPEAIAWYETHSPSSYAHRATTPTLIVHGEADQRCPIGQSEQMFATLKQAGCEVEFARYPGGSHGFPRLGPPEHRVDYLQRSLDWFKAHLGEPK